MPENWPHDCAVEKQVKNLTFKCNQVQIEIYNKICWKWTAADKRDKTSLRKKQFFSLTRAFHSSVCLPRRLRCLSGRKETGRGWQQFGSFAWTRETAALRHLHPTWQTVCVFTASHVNICGWDLKRKAVMQLWKPMGPLWWCHFERQNVTIQKSSTSINSPILEVFFFLIGTNQEPAAG